MTALHARARGREVNLPRSRPASPSVPAASECLAIAPAVRGVVLRGRTAGLLVLNERLAPPFRRRAPFDFAKRAAEIAGAGKAALRRDRMQLRPRFPATRTRSPRTRCSSAPAAAARASAPSTATSSKAPRPASTTARRSRTTAERISSARRSTSAPPTSALTSSERGVGPADSQRGALFQTE